ncbi:hypothetical protein COJ46_05005 [Bacillus sp. AFS077874]|nr:hypothetical protein CON00_12095 [Bacillus sp. AFS096315]PFM82341.1 hypothetical protein COJ46_05005 [Bacillus sp. AFS077874]
MKTGAKERKIYSKTLYVCYTCESSIKWENVTQGLEVTIEEIRLEVMSKLLKYDYFFVKNEKGFSLINSSLVRYVRIVHEKTESKKVN